MTDDSQAIKEPFPIRELSARTQVNTVTLRAWERRYGLLKPARTAKGHRLYCDEDVSTIEKILALVARGVPLGKVKSLLEGELEVASPVEVQESWQVAVDKLIGAIESFSSSKVEHLLHEAIGQYPAPICRERLLEPVFSELTLRDDHGALFGFAESELMRYAALRLNPKADKKKGAVALTLVAGNQAPMWGLALMALELTDAEFSVQLLHRPFSLDAGIELAWRLGESYTVFYQDGIWREAEQKRVAKALLANDRLFMCGTAPVLTNFGTQARVFADVKDCIADLLTLQS